MEAIHVRRALIVGGGVMGHSIAQVFAQAGIETNLMDVSQKVLDHAIRMIKSNLETLADHGNIGRDEINEILEHVHPFTELSEAARGVDFVLEAVSEDPGIKADVFSKLEDHCPKDIVFASNTSGLDIFNLVKMENIERLLIAHWFTPAHIIPLVEIVPGPMTSPQHIKFTSELMQSIGKKTIVMKKFVPSFIVNRFQKKIVETVFEFLANDWASPEEIDYALKTSLGIRLPIIGAVQSLDFNGLDLIKMKSQIDGFSLPALDKMVEHGHLGVKTSKGFYNYDGRSEKEILKKRDRLFLALNDFLESINAFDPV